MYANLIRKLKKTVQSEKFVARHRKSSKDFTRTRQLPFRTLIYFLLNLVKGSLQDELDHFSKRYMALNFLNGWSPRVHSP
jgi:hypothetical protein